MGLFRRIKNNKKPVLRQIIDLVPRWMLDSCTKQFKTDKGCSKYRTYDQFVALTFGQLNIWVIIHNFTNMMNRLKTFLFYIGVIVLSTLFIRVFAFLSNKVFDNLRDVYYAPILGAALGYMPIMMAAEVTLRVTNNYEKTRKIIWVWKLSLAFVIILLGIDLFFERLYSDYPLFKLDEKVSFLSFPEHWLFYVPLGVSGIIAALKIKKDKII